MPRLLCCLHWKMRHLLQCVSNATEPNDFRREQDEFCAPPFELLLAPVSVDVGSSHVTSVETDEHVRHGCFPPHFHNIVYIFLAQYKIVETLC